MAIDITKLICAPMLQDYLVDKDGTPMAAGTVTAYHDNARTVLKNWYYQSGTPGNYTYIPLPNPLTLSASGTICDANGNDTLPFYYPVSEVDNITADPYFFVIQDYSQTYTITRANFPYNTSGGFIPITGGVSDENYIINNRFWRNIGSANVGTLTNNFLISYNSSGNSYYQTLAPSQHDGFSMPDLNYIKDVNGATETITFSKFSPPLNLTADIAPEFYINHACTGAEDGEMLKVYQFPLSLHIASLSNVPLAFTIQAQSVSGSSQISVYLYQFLGTGVTSGAPILLGGAPIQLTSSWSKYTITEVIPSSFGKTIGGGGDDALYIQIGMPLGVTFNLNFALPSVFVNSTTPVSIPINSFATYDQIDSVVGTPRTGDIRTSLNSFYYYGWVPMNNGTIGNASSNATSRANIDSWPLYNLLWNSFSAYSTGSSSSGTNPLAQMYTSGGTMVGYGSGVTAPTTAIADFNANKALALTQTMGQVLLGTVPVSTLLPTYSTTYTASDSSGNLLLTTINTVGLFTGMPIYFTNSGGSLPGGLSANTIYYVGAFNGSNAFNVCTSFANSVTRTFIAYSSAGSGTNTVIGGLAGTFEGEYTHLQSIPEIPYHTHNSFFDTSSGTILNGVNTGGGGGLVGGSTVVASATTGGVTGGNSNVSPLVPMNVTQPGLFANLFIKL